MPISLTKLAIRLSLQGCTNRPFYHVVVMLKHKGAQKTPIEQLGSFDPMPNEHQERLVAINFDRLKYWIAKGAEPTKSVEQVLGLCGFFPIHPMTYAQAKRNRNKKAEEKEQLENQQNEETVS